MLFDQIIDEFHKEKISYAVVGGYALALHGIVRATIDIDFVLKIDLESYEKAEKALVRLGLTSRIPVRASDIIKMRKEFISKRNLIAWSFVDVNNPTKQVDILIVKDVSELAVVKISVHGKKISVASLESLLKMKSESKRPQDVIDIERIKRELDEKK